MSVNLLLIAGDTGAGTTASPGYTPTTSVSYELKGNRGQFATVLPHDTNKSLNSFDLDIIGLTSNGSGSILLQRSADNGANWSTIKTYTADASETGYASHKAIYRIVFNGVVAANKTIIVWVR